MLLRLKKAGITYRFDPASRILISAEDNSSISLTENSTITMSSDGKTLSVDYDISNMLQVLDWMIKAGDFIVEGVLVPKWETKDGKKVLTGDYLDSRDPLPEDKPRIEDLLSGHPGAAVLLDSVKREEAIADVAEGAWEKVTIDKKDLYDAITSDLEKEKVLKNDTPVQSTEGVIYAPFKRMVRTLMF